MELAVRLSLLSCIQAQINVTVYALPADGGDFLFTSKLDFGKYSHSFYTVLLDLKNGGPFGNLVILHLNYVILFKAGLTATSSLYINITQTLT